MNDMNKHFVFSLGLKDKKKRIELKWGEIRLLEELTIHRVLESKEIHLLYRSAVKGERSTSSISNRLKRFREVGILLCFEIHKKPDRLPRYYYKIGHRGLQILVEANVLSEDKANALHDYILKAKVPKAHNQAASKIANQVKVMGILDSFTDFQHYRGSEEDSLNLSLNENSLKDEVIVADWVFTRNQNIIFMEVDSGNQSIKVIENKIERYLHLARRSDQHMKVIFSVMDGTVSAKYADIDRARRIFSIKECCPPMQEWPTNISFYAVTAERTSELIMRLIKGFEPVPAELREIIINDWVDDWRNSLEDSYSISLLDIDKVYSENERIKVLDADVVVELKTSHSNRKFALMYGEEGSIQTHQRLRAVHNRTTRDVIKGDSFDRVIVVYSEKEYAEKDIYGLLFENAFYGFRDIWLESSEQEPEIMRQVTPNRKEWVPFE